MSFLFPQEEKSYAAEGYERLILRYSGNNRLRYQKGGETQEKRPSPPSERLSYKQVNTVKVDRCAR